MDPSEGRIDLGMDRNVWKALLERTEGLKRFFFSVSEYKKALQAGTLEHLPDMTVLVGPPDRLNVMKGGVPEQARPVVAELGACGCAPS